MKSGASLRAAIFVIVSALLLTAVGVTVGRFRSYDDATFSAIFSDSNGLNPGDEVRAAGVRVGSVESVNLMDDNQVRVGFTVADSVPMTEAAQAAIRYKSLTGVKYLELLRSPGGAPALAAGSTIPVSQTNPGLDLDEVFNSFKPLSQGLSPTQINDLSASVIQVFQGESGAIDGLLTNLAGLTSHLADRDQVIGELITNFKVTLGTISQRRSDLDTTVVNLRKLIQGLAKDRGRLVDSLEQVTALAGTGSELLSAARPGLRDLVLQTGNLTDALNTDLPAINHYLEILPEAVRLAGRLGAYGAFYNLYICGLTVKLSSPAGEAIKTQKLDDDSERCQSPERGR